ncbi:MAG: lipopolysaccharide heptosyltransferase II [Pseudomonadota bacterium]
MNLADRHFRRILVRSTNWVGDALLTTPALSALADNFPDAEITVLVKPWAAPIFAHHPAVAGTMIYDRSGPHGGLLGLASLVREIRSRQFELAVLFQNAFEAAALAFAARIPWRVGYNTDARGFLLHPAVPLYPGDRVVHQTQYYLRLLGRVGLKTQTRKPVFHLSPAIKEMAGLRLQALGLENSFLIGLAPGAAYGPAKQWPPEKFAAAADEILDQKPGGAALVFGSPGEARVAARVRERMRHPAHDLSGRTSLDEAAALIHRCHLFLTNDSGLMHVAAAVDAPLVAIFGSTDAKTTSPAGDRAVMVSSQVDCAPCLKPVCPKVSHRCMDLIAAGQVARAGLDLLDNLTK